MKARQHKPQTEQNQRTAGHRFKPPRRAGHHRLCGGKGVPLSRGRRPVQGSLSVQRHAVNQPSGHRWGTDYEQPAGAGLGQCGRRSDPWQLQQQASTSVRSQWRSPFHGQDGSQGTSEQGGSQCFRGQPFRFGQQGRGQKPVWKGGGRGGKGQRQTQPHTQAVGSQTSEFRRTRPRRKARRQRQQANFRSESLDTGPQGGRPRTPYVPGKITSAVPRPKCPSVDQLISEVVEKFLNLESNPTTGDFLQPTTSGVEPHKSLTRSQSSPLEVAIKKKVKPSRWDVPSRTAASSFAGSTKGPEESESSKRSSHWGVPSTTVTSSVASGSKESVESELGKSASHWDDPLKTTTLSVGGHTKGPEESESSKVKGQHSGQLLVRSTDPQVEIVQTTEQFVKLTRLWSTPAEDSPASVTHSEVSESSNNARDNPCYSENKKKSSGDSHKKNKLKLRHALLTAKASPTPKQKQEYDGIVTGLYSNIDDDFELDGQPQAPQKSPESKCHPPQFPEKIDKSKSGQPPELQRSQSAESAHALVALCKTPGDDKHRHTVVNSETSSGIPSQHTAAEKEKKLEHKAYEDLEGLPQLQPLQKGINSQSVLKGKTPTESLGLGSFHPASSAETQAERRIVKVKPRQRGSSSELPFDQRKTYFRSLSVTPLSAVSDSSHRRLIKVKSYDRSFRAVLSTGFSEDQKSKTRSVSETEINTSRQDLAAEKVSEKETASAAYDSDETLSDTVTEHTWARDFDFSGLFPHSQAEEESVVDFLADRCANVTLASTQTGGRDAHYRECENETLVDDTYLSHYWQYNDYDQWFKQQYEGDYGTEYAESDNEFENSYYDEKSDLWEDIPDPPDGYGHRSPELSNYPSQADKLESCSEKKTSTVDVPHTSSSVSVSPEKSQQKETRWTEINLPSVKKTKKGSLTSFNERDKLKALFSVRKKGSLKLTARAESSGACSVVRTPEKDKCFEAGLSRDGPPVAENTITNVKDAETDCISSNEEQTESSEIKTAGAAFTQQTHSVNTSMSDPKLHTEYAVLVSKDSEQLSTPNPVRCESTDLSQSDQTDLFLTEIQQHDHTQKQRHVSSDFSDAAEQSFQSDMVIDDDEILREIDSCLEFQRPLHEERTVSAHAVESRSFVTEASSQSALDTTSPRHTESSKDRKWIGKGNFDKEVSSHISTDDSHTLTAAVRGLTVQDSYKKGTAIQPVFNPSINFSVNTLSSGAIPVQDPPPGSHITVPGTASGTTRVITGKLQMVENITQDPEIGSTILSQSASGNHATRSCVRLEQDPSGTTDVNIFMDITARNSLHTGKGPDGNPSVPAGSVPSERSKLDLSTATTSEVGQCSLAEKQSPSEEEFVTTYISLVVPRNKPLEISFEPVMNADTSPEDKNIEIEVTAESGFSSEDLTPAERASGVSEPTADSSSAHVTERNAVHSEMMGSATDSQTTSTEILDVEDLDQCGEGSIDDTQVEATSVATAASNSTSEDRIKDSNATAETDSQQQTMPSATTETDNQLQTLKSATTETGNQLQTLKLATTETGNQLQTLKSATTKTGNQLQTLHSATTETSNQLQTLNSATTETSNQLQTLNSATTESSHQLQTLNSETGNQLQTLNLETSSWLQRLNSASTETGNRLQTLNSASTETGNRLQTLNSASTETGNRLQTLNSASTETGNRLQTLNSASTETGNRLQTLNSASTETGNQLQTLNSASTETGNRLQTLNSASTETGNRLQTLNSASTETGNRLQTLNSASTETGQTLHSAANETSNPLQTLPSHSVEAEGEKMEMTSVDHYPSSPPSLTHCSQFDHGDYSYSLSTSSPPQLKPQTTLPAPQHLLIRLSPVAADPDVFTWKNSEPMEIDDIASQDFSPVSAGLVSPVPPPPNLSRVDDDDDACVSSVVANPVVAPPQAVEGDGGSWGDVDVVSGGGHSAWTSCSSADLSSASLSAVMPTQVFRAAADNMTDLDASYSDHDENKSPESEDSDDSLGDEPEFLSSVIGGPTPLTTVSTNVPAQSVQVMAGESSGQAHCQPTSFSLDSLLRDTKKDEAAEQETMAMQEQLRKELLSGDSLSQEDNENDEMDYDDFTDEQKRTLKKLNLEEQAIQDSAPGEEVLRDPCWGRLFTETVSPAACGVHMPNARTCLRQLFEDYQPCTLMDILSSDIISLTYHSLPCKSEIQRWLFFIMSIHSSAVEVKKCADQLHQVLQWQMGDAQQKYTWTPSLLDLFRVFVNWGADLQDLVFDTSVVDPQQLKETLPLEISTPPQGVPVSCFRNFEPVLKMLVSWLQARPGYRTEELNQLLLMLCRLSLDHSLCKTYILTELQVCLASILESYQPSEWNSVVPWLCRRLRALSDHHHNQVYVAKLLSSVCPRSRYLQQRLAYLLLHSALTPSQPLSDTHIHRFQLADLLGLIPEFKHVLQNDNYQVASLVQLLDLSVGPAAHHISQKKQLFQLLEAVRLIVSEIRDSMQRLDCTKVKGMLLHLCLKWDLAVKANNIKQRKIFSCFSSTTQIQIEQLEDHGPNDDDDNNTVDDDSSTSFSDNNNSSNEEEVAAPEAKILKRDRSCEDVKSPKDRKHPHGPVTDCGDTSSRTGISESSSSTDFVSNGNNRLGIFETLKMEKMDERHSGGCDDERFDASDIPTFGDTDTQDVVGASECVQSGGVHSDIPQPHNTQVSSTSIVGSAPAVDKSRGPDSDRSRTCDRSTVLDTNRFSAGTHSADSDSDDSLPEL